MKDFLLNYQNLKRLLIKKIKIFKKKNKKLSNFIKIGKLNKNYLNNYHNTIFLPKSNDIFLNIFYAYFKLNFKTFIKEEEKKNIFYENEEIILLFLLFFKR